MVRACAEVKIKEKATDLSSKAKKCFLSTDQPPENYGGQEVPVTNAPILRH